jgi:hypothetical protein
VHAKAGSASSCATLANSPKERALTRCRPADHIHDIRTANKRLQHRRLSMLELTLDGLRVVSGAGGPGQFGKAGRAALPVAGGNLIDRMAPDAAEDGGALSVDLRWV